MEAYNSLEKSIRWLQHIVKGDIGQELETRALEGLQITHARKGFLQFSFIVPTLASDVDGNWHVGAIATLVDIVGAAAVYSVVHRVNTSVDFSISYYSTAKIREQVDVDAKVMANKGRLTQVMVDVRRKANGELIALGKQWMAANNLTISQVSSKL